MRTTIVQSRPNLWHSIANPAITTSNRPFVRALPIVRHISRTGRPGFHKLIRNMRIYPVFQTFDIICNSTEATRAAVIHPLKSPIRLLVPPAGVARHAAGSSVATVAGRLQLAESRSASRASDRLGVAPQSGECRQKDGCAEDNKSAHPYKNGVSVRKSIRANRHAMPSEGWMCGPSNPHIRIFQRHTIDAIAVVSFSASSAHLPRTLRPS